MKPLTGYMHGVNLGGWLSQCVHTKEHYDTFILEDDIKKIASWKLDHVRIPVDYDLVETREGDYKEDGFAYIQTAIDWCKKYNLNMILDLHKTFGFSFDVDEKEVGFFDNPAYQERFYKLWEQFAKRFAANEDMLCFELLNEVTDQSFSAKWNAISDECIKHIRTIAPTIKILVGSYWNNSVSSVKDLNPPLDRNVVYNFHCYEPLIFTHQGAQWLPKMGKTFRTKLEIPLGQMDNLARENFPHDVAYFGTENPDAIISEESFEKHFASALKVAEERDVTLYCGEFGVIDYADPVEALKWYKLVCAVLDKHEIGRAAWSYKSMNFGLADPWFDTVRDDLLKIL